MRGANQVYARTIKELPLLPIELDRNMAATVQIGMHLSPKTHQEGGLAGTEPLNREAHAGTTLYQFIAAADPALGQDSFRNQPASSATSPAQ